MQTNNTEFNSVYKTLEKLDEKIDDSRPLTNELVNHLHNVIEESFENQVTPDGDSWTPIKKTGRQKTDGSQKILFKTGHMQNSLYSYSVIGGGAVVGLNATSNGYQYPLVHQFGTKDKTIVARAFMPIKLDGSLYEKTEKELDDIVDDYFEFLD